MGAGSVAEKDQADKVFEGTLKSLFALSESYPDLKANTNFVSLQQQNLSLSGILNEKESEIKSNGISESEYNKEDNIENKDEKKL